MRAHLLAVLFSISFLVAACGKTPVGPGGTDNPGDQNGSDGGSSCPASCPTAQHCDATAAKCVCDNPCSAAGAVCDPAGSGKLGTCVQDAVSGCFSVTALAACTGTSQTCPIGATACACPSTPACTAGQTRCKTDGTGTDVCQADTFGCLGWVAAVNCTTHQTCSPTGGTGGKAGCICNDACPSAGANPSLQCSASSPAGSYQICSADASSCRYWADTACPLGQLCDTTKAGAGTAPACSCPTTAVCTIGAVQCNTTTGNPETCVNGAGGCPMWSQTATCNPLFQQCVVNGAAASCQCKTASPNCNAGTTNQTFCPVNGGNQYQTCLQDGPSGCFYFDAAKSCPSTQQTCVVANTTTSQGACQCPATQCVPGTSSCGGNVLTKCSADAGGCGVSTTADCTATHGAGSTCNATPTPHCTCSPVTNGIFFADATLGDDAFGTGASSPPECAFKSLTKGLATAGSGQQIIARSGTYSRTTSGDNFPIALKDGVTLTTEFTPTAALPYVIDGSGNINVPPIGGVSTAIVYTGTASPTLRNFTLRGTGNHLLICNGGTPALDGIVADSGAGRGIGIIQACAPALTNVTTKNNGAEGIRVATGAGTTTITNGLSDADSQGLLVENGSVTVNRFEIRNSTNLGAALIPTNVSGISRSITLSATGFNIHNNAGDGLDVDIGNNVPYGAVTIASSDFAWNAGIGIRLRASSPSMIGLNVHDNDSDGLRINGANATVSASSFNSNAKANVAPGVQLLAGTLSLSGSSTAPTTVSRNQSVGIGAFGGTLAVTGITVDGNQNGGIVLGTPGGGGTPVSATLSDLRVSNNVNGPGIAMLGQAGGTIDRCDVSGNGGTVTAPIVGTVNVGGIVIATGARDVLTSFTGNKVHSNLFDGVHVFFSGQTLGPAACGAANASANQFYCYGAGNFGVAASNIFNGGVSANNNVWANITPSTAQRDFNANVAVNASCNASITTCP